MKMWSRVGDKTQKRRRALTLAQRCHGPAFDFEDNEEMAGNSTLNLSRPANNYRIEAASVSNTESAEAE